MTDTEIYTVMNPAMNRLYYVHDPMCSWCWGFTDTWQQLRANLPEQIEVIRLLGGLAPDTDAPMPEAMQRSIINTWHRVAEHIPGVNFNFDFWTNTTPRRTTYPACRAVIAARQQGLEYDTAMTTSIQHAYYLEACNPSNESTLIELASELGLDTHTFIRTLRDPSTHETLLKEIKLAREMHADSFPDLVLKQEDNYWHIQIDYTNYRSMHDSIMLHISSG